jgi:hypothetical protein
MTRHHWIMAIGLGLLGGCATRQPLVAPEPTPPGRRGLGQPLKSQHVYPRAEVQPALNPQGAAEPAKLQRKAEDPAAKAPPASPIQTIGLTPTTVAPEPPEKAQPAQDDKPAGPVFPPQTIPELVKPPLDDPPLLAALRALLEKRSDQAIHHLLGYDKPTQEMLLCLLPVVARLGSGSLDSADPQELAHLLDQVESARASLRPRVPLQIERMTFCRDIAGFGDYQPLPEDNPFRPGELVEVYAEIRNFSSLAVKGVHEIRLASTLEMRDPAGRARPRTVQPLRTSTDQNRSPRHDHFQHYCFYIPENLQPGHYSLVLQVNDLSSQPPRTAQKSLHLWVTTRPIARP